MHPAEAEHVLELFERHRAGFDRARQRIGDERAAVATAAADEEAGVGELADRLAHGVAAHRVHRRELALGRERLPGRDDAEPDGLHEARDGVFEGVALAHRPVDGPVHLPQRRVGHRGTAVAVSQLSLRSRAPPATDAGIPRRSASRPAARGLSYDTHGRGTAGHSGVT